MPDPTTNPAAAQGAIDLTKYVPKEEAEKQASSLKGELDTLKNQLEEARMATLSPEYIAYLESKKNPQPAKQISPDEAAKMNPQQLIEAAVNQARSMVKEEVLTRLNQQGQALENVLAMLEVRDVQERYPDFVDFKPEVAKLLDQPGSTLTIEQAYLIARSQNPEKAAESAKKRAPQPDSERPSRSVPAHTLQPKSFKTSREANMDAWDRVVGAGRDTL